MRFDEHNELCVERMLDLHKKIASTRTPEDKMLYKRQIAAADQQIDSLGYDLYGLTGEEIKIVERVCK